MHRILQFYRLAMAGFGRMLLLLVLTVVDAKTPSATMWTGGGSLTMPAFVAPQGRHLQCGPFSSIVGDARYYSPKVMCPTRRHVSLLAKPKPSDEEMEQRKEQLRVLLCATKAEIDKLVGSSNPDVLNRRDIVENHGPKVALLQERLGISQKDAGKLCLSANRLLCSSLETLESKIDWLVSRLNINKTQLRNIIKARPAVFTFSIKGHLEPALGNIQSNLELSDNFG